MAQKLHLRMANIKGILLAAVAFAVVAGVIVFSIPHERALPHNAALAFSGFPAEQEMDVLLQSRSGAAALSKQDDFFLNPATPFSPPYKLGTTIKTAQQYRDLLFTVDKDRTTLTVLADGFTSDDKITLRLDDTIVFDSVPMDWSGRIELKTALTDKKTATACLEIDSKDIPFGACHAVPEGRKI